MVQEYNPFFFTRRAVFAMLPGNRTGIGRSVALAGFQDMFSHDRIWAAIDALAERNRLSPSGLARRAGLDPTSFNKSKRQGADGRQRWPSTESIAKVLDATGASIDEFFTLAETRDAGLPQGVFPPQAGTIPLLGFAQAGAGGFFDDGGFPAGQG